MGYPEEYGLVILRLRPYLLQSLSPLRRQPRWGFGEYWGSIGVNSFSSEEQRLGVGSGSRMAASDKDC